MNKRFIKTRQIEEGVVKKALSFQELAEKIEVPADAFVKTMGNYNGYVETGRDLEFGRASHALKFKIETPPFYASPVYPAIHHTMGGLRINPKAQELDRRERVIPGLYAAGEVTGGVHGANRYLSHRRLYHQGNLWIGRVGLVCQVC